MIKVLLVDDEPLVLVGLQSMLCWADYGAEIVGTARNGKQAIELIDSLAPDLVITDIKMPVQTGLEVIQQSRERHGDVPVFIVLTSFEEFGFATEALRAGAVDYLVKLELTPQNLSDAIGRAAARVHELDKRRTPHIDGAYTGLQKFKDKFFIRLYNNLFDSKEQYLVQRDELGLSLAENCYAVVYCEVGGAVTIPMGQQKLMALYVSTLKITVDTVRKYLPCHATELDIRHFNLLLCISDETNWQETARKALTRAATMVRNYFSVQLLCGVGLPQTDVFFVCDSYRSARRIAVTCLEENPIAFAGEDTLEQYPKAVFNISQYRQSLQRALEEMNTEALYTTVTEITDAFSDPSARLEQAMDAACNLLYMTLSLLPDGETNAEQIFTDYADSYRCLYRCKTIPQCCEWMLRLRDGLCEILQNRHQNYKERIVANVQEYIKANLDKKLSLQQVAAVFNFSPNYLSQLFARNAGESFVGYITEARIHAAKTMMSTTNKKIYEIAQELGFESAFYFSKVFKKGTGMSPREYLNNRKG